MSTKTIKTIIKTLALILILTIDYALIMSGFRTAAIPDDAEDITYEERNVEKYYYERDFISMMEEMTRNQFVADDMNVYREARDAYVLKMKCEMYKDTDAKKEYNEAFESLSQMKNSCEPENADLIGEFIESVK